jgi:hypothetical protein
MVLSGQRVHMTASNHHLLRRNSFTLGGQGFELGDLEQIGKSGTEKCYAFLPLILKVSKSIGLHYKGMTWNRHWRYIWQPNLVANQ